jgi:predicted acetyltransferase
MQRRCETFFAYLVANSLYRTRRRKRFAKDGLRLLFARCRDNLGIGAELVAEFDNLGRGVIGCEINPPQLQSWHLGNLAENREEAGLTAGLEYLDATESRDIATGFISLRYTVVFA